MFSHQLPNSNELLGVKFSSYAQKHFLNKFKKKYKGKVWDYTEMSIKEDLSRLCMSNNTTQLSNQIDELIHKNNCWLAKYDFKIAGTKLSTKGSGNRCILFINTNTNLIEILLIYNKTDLPKNIKETKYIMDVLNDNYSDIMKQFCIEL